MALTRIVAIVVDTEMLTLYKPDGSTIKVAQGDPRVLSILEAMPKIEKQGYAMFELNPDNPYRDFQKKSSGLTRFFRVAKEKVKNLFEEPRKAEAPVGTVGTVPGEQLSTKEAVADIMAHAKPVDQSDSEDDLADEETVVAVTTTKGTKGKSDTTTVISGAEQLKGHLRHSAKVGSTKGMEAFFARITPVIAQRRHSIEDLLRFMEKNDLPIADDGSLIVYKVLKKRNGTYFDCHTDSVPQKIGSFVCVDPKLVDLNRDQECSNGLHVARRGYIGSFSGDACTLVKVAPEDVMTVPHRDPNKVRVCGYHILMELEKEAWDKLKRNVPMTDNPKAQKMLGRAVSGDHVAVLERVVIGGSMGSNVKVEIIEGPKPKTTSKVIVPAVALDDETVAPKGVSEADKAKAKTTVSNVIKAGSARKAKVLELLKVIKEDPKPEAVQAAAKELLAYKKASKVSWANLGVGDADAKRVLDASVATPPQVPIEETVRTEEPTPQAIPTPTPVLELDQPIQKNVQKNEVNRLADIVLHKTTPVQERVAVARQLLDLRRKKKQSWTKLGRPDLNDEYLRTIVNSNIDVAPPKAKAAKKKVEVVPTPAPTSKPKKETTKETTTGSRQERARVLFNQGQWKELIALKKKSKVYWDKLGFSAAEIDQIKLHIGD